MQAKLLFGLVVAALGTQIATCARNTVSFSEDIQPILKASCLGCHGGSIDRGKEATLGEGSYTSGFSVVDYESIMQGTSLGPVVVPGSSMSSALYLVVAGKTDPAIRMPPHHDESWAQGRGVPLSARQIDMIGAWIDQGANNN